MRRRMQCLLLVLLTALLSAGCSGGDDKVQEGSYFIYYTNIEATKVTPIAYLPETDTGEELVNELLMELATPPGTSDSKVAKPESVTVDRAELADGNLVLRFSESYREMDRVTEVLCRAAYVRTLTQIPDVDTVEFYLGDEPLTDVKGVEIGKMTGEDFIDNTDEEISAYQVETITLYFANKAGDKLVPVTQSAVLDTNVSKERNIVEKLLKGPTSENVIGTIPEGTKLLGVSTEEGICYVNLSEEYLTPLPDVTENVSLFSIVNSLCELPNVEQVQFAINGDSERTFIEDVTFSVPFRENKKLVEVGN